tara:strand:+ start:1774 stop:2196 length:423 start_codon:yes stop_codon:yes gene_type:complete
MNPEPEPEETDLQRYQRRRAGGNPRREDIPAGTPMNTLRERLDAFGRLERFEAEGARRRRERALNPEILDEDTYRARQRLAGQMVLNKFMGGMNIPKLTGEGHTNPTVEARGGKIGSAVSQATPVGINVQAELASLAKLK